MEGKQALCFAMSLFVSLVSIGILKSGVNDALFVVLAFFAAFFLFAALSGH